MSSLALNSSELSNLRNIVEMGKPVKVSLKQMFNEIGCDKYDCFFRGVQCPCEGICDGKA